MPRIRLDFPNARGERLVGLLETPPPHRPTLRYALFAHCFTCGKDLAAASRISRALAARGIAVLRFDFTGLGNSDGDFANTNFSSNIDDLLAAAAKLAADFAAPALLIGHSLGGAAVLVAAQRLPSVEAVVTIGAPATAIHVRHLFSHASDELARAGTAEVKIGRRRFTIKQQFLDDLETYGDAAHIKQLERPLLVFHSPIDDTVAISEAAQIYQAARHPKSFISLDRADHLLTNPVDATYVADTLVAWAGRYLNLTEAPATPAEGRAPPVEPGAVLVREYDHSSQRGLFSERHQLLADLPASLGGRALGPTPYDLLQMAVGASLSLILREEAQRLGVVLDDVEILIQRPADTHGGCTKNDPPLTRLTCTLRLTGALDSKARTALLQAAQHCPLVLSLDGRLAIDGIVEPL